MFKSIFQKEILDHFLSLRFIVGLVLCVAVTVTCVLILANDYEEELRDYNQRIAMQDDFLNNHAHTNRLMGMIYPERPPESFRPLIIGVPKDADLGSFDDNPLPILFPPLDLVFIVTILMSLMAILFSYDAIAGEREAGTLKLMISNTVQRATVLLAKWAGGTVCLLIPFILSLLVGAIIITIHPFIQWDATAWTTFLFLTLGSATFISVYYLLGLFISSKSPSSSTSILTCLLIWVLFNLVVPNVSPYLSSQFYSIPSVNRIQKEVRRLRGVERDNLGNQLSAVVRERFASQYGEMFNAYIELDRDGVRRRSESDPAFKDMVNAYRTESGKAWSEANRIQREKAEQIQSELIQKSAVQTQLAKHIACISPYANFIYFATDISGTGLRSLTFFDRTTEEFLNRLVPYLQRKEEEAQSLDSTYDSNTFLDISDRPRYSYKEESLSNKLASVMLYWGILIFFNILFFALAFTGFMKYDVR